MNNSTHRLNKKKHRHIIARTVTYILAIIATLALSIFILVCSHSTEIQFIAMILGIWILLTIFFCYKIHRTLHYLGVFQKGSLTVGELDDLDGIAFEELACEILVANGFELAENTKASGDFGVDILATKDGINYAIQCKRYHDKVGLEAIQEVYAGRAYYECHVAVVLTNQLFTPNAIKLADKIGVVLWDRETLRELL